MLVLSLEGLCLGPMLYIVMAKDLRALSKVNRLLKYATSLLVPSNSDVELDDEFENVKQWAKDNRMILNSSKTKEIVFRRPNQIICISKSSSPD